MKLLQVNRTDVTGGRFNGYALRKLFAQRGVESTHLVWDKASADPDVHRLFTYPGSRLATRAIHRIERELSLHAELELHSFGLPLHKQFRDADVVHYHIIHDGFFSLHALPFLSRLKPSIWTWHDPWPMTGHCIYPMGCERWKLGCGACPDLSLHFPMKEDRTRHAASMKRKVIENADIDVIVASEFMEKMARQSFTGSSARIHLVPFGLDLELYKPRPKQQVRRRLGIPDENVVIALRAISSTFKGLPNFIEALDSLQPSRPITILSVQETGYFNHHIGRHQIVELGWVKDDDTLIDALSAADIFAMPSTAEAFGLMALEAMACGAPVVVFEGTSLPQVVGAPDVGIAVPMGDSKALAAALVSLIDDEDDRHRRSIASRLLMQERYSAEVFADRLVAVYQSAIDRRKAGPVR